jgi:transcriptional regulator with XRE-family HTH domain
MKENFKKRDFKVTDERGNVSYGTFPSRIKLLRERSGYTIDQVASACGVAPSFMAKVEGMGDKEALQRVGIDELSALHKLYGVSIDLLIMPEECEDNLADICNRS